ncbi:MAG: type I DNA topoisomerase, partial [Muribaculaceae bacterium]|nr:type I DNA topoisomerase [Muribaculaceae bacterium]
ASQAGMVWLASDVDREGEGIAWHLFEVLDLDPAKTRRIVFHEITKNAILNAIDNPRGIDINLVDAQQARRVLDRIVGFELSPVLWKKIKPALSAGRVQSVAVRLIVERENEIKKFVPEEYVRLTADFMADDVRLRTEFTHRLPDLAVAGKFLEVCAGSEFAVGDIAVKPLKKSPAPPFTTSTLQQEAARKLGFTVSQTMMIAQRLYEAGYITYMRTDSVNLSSLAINAISKEITENIGEQYLKVRQYHTSTKGAQEAHEAIRPTYIDRVTIEGTSQEKRLYGLIRKRTIASQMADALIEKTTIDIDCHPGTKGESLPVDGRFVASGEVIKFDGFLRMYLEGRDDEEGDAEQSTLPQVTAGQVLALGDVTAAQRFTSQPLRYTEASLVKKLEELGIGRPSTYAPTISTIQQREYVERGDRPGTQRDVTVLTLSDGKISRRTVTETVGAEKGKLIPTDIGVVVNDFLTEYFPDILDYNFTAKVEQKFDDIAEGKLVWNDEIASFYKDFHPVVDNAMSMRLEHKVGERVLGIDPVSGKPVSVKIGRFGPLVQVGEVDKEEKPRFASLLKGQSVQTITLEDALKLFDFPRLIGDYEGEDVTVAIGRFGPYIKHAGAFTSIPKDIAPEEITIEQAIELINEKRAEASKRIVRTFDEDPDLQILNGRYGIYIACNKKNYKIPKTVEDPASLTLEQCREIIAAQDAAPKKTARRTSRKG